MARAGIVLIQADEVALIERTWPDGVRYFVFPGGGAEGGERLEEAAAREAREELGLTIHVGPLAAWVEFPGEPDATERRAQYYFWAEAVAGEFGTGDGREIISSGFTPRGSYRPVWLPVEKLGLLDVRPRELATALCKRLLTRGAEPVLIRESRPIGHSAAQTEPD